MQRPLLTCLVSSLILAAAISTFASAAQTIEQVITLRERGDFEAAAVLIASALEDQKLSGSDRGKLYYHSDLLKRIRLDYTLSESELIRQISASLKGFTPEEFQKWKAEKRFDSRSIDGQLRYFAQSLPNLYFRYPELNDRRITPNPKNTPEAQKKMLAQVRQIKKAAAEQNSPYVLPYRYKCRMTVDAALQSSLRGKTMRAWLPVPRAYPFQTDFKVLSSSPAIKTLAPETRSIRSAYFEQPVAPFDATKFRIEYEYTISGVRFPLDPEKSKPIDPKDPTLKKYLSQAPHVVFTPKIKELADRIAGPEKNPVLKAKAFFDWIASNIRYSYAREYSTLTNISDYCYSNLYGDCGQEALLFITLCRSAGIPARWQSGWHLVPGAVTNHDWTEIYLAPWGWVPCDPWAGIHAMRYCTALSPEERQELRDFYFGGNDQYRMIANCDHNQALSPTKKSPRSDDVDFQRGELDCNDKNIYFNKFKYSFQVLEMTPLQKK